MLTDNEKNELTGVMSKRGYELESVTRDTELGYHFFQAKPNCINVYLPYGLPLDTPYYDPSIEWVEHARYTVNDTLHICYVPKSFKELE